MKKFKGLYVKYHDGGDSLYIIKGDKEHEEET